VNGVLPVADIDALRRLLDGHGYAANVLTERLGSAQPPSAGNLQSMLTATDGVAPIDVLARLFLIGAAVPEQRVVSALGAEFLPLCSAGDWVRVESNRCVATIVITPVEGLLFASDAFRFAGEDERSFVLPATTQASTALRRTTLHDPVRRALDLGCGCGVQALIAARHCERVVATDISDRALAFTRFNARLNNIDNVECRPGSLFDPVAGERFDLIVCNPPFVIGPSSDWGNRDNPFDLDELCASLLAAAPEFLERDGRLHMLSEWVEVAGQPWHERLVVPAGCDLLVMHSAPLTPADYVAVRGDAIRAAGSAPAKDDAWIRYLQDRGVIAIHPAVVLLRRRNGPNWTRSQPLTNEPDEDTARAIAALRDSLDLLTLCTDAAALLQARLRPAPFVAVPQFPGQARGGEAALHLGRRRGLQTGVDLDRATAVFVQQMDGERTLAECIDEMAGRMRAPRRRLESELLGISRELLARGLLVPAD
jgi:predicted RNA methylase